MLKIKYTAGTRVSKGKPKYVYPPAKKKVLASVPHAP